jgi:glycosyltransferase involved in cell wall biosynthesis
LQYKTNLQTYCFISQQYPPETGFGGIGTYVWHMARALTLNGIDVTVFSYSTEQDKIYLEDGIKVVRKKIDKSRYLSWYIEVMRFLTKNTFHIIEDAEFSGSTFLYLLLFKHRRHFIYVRLHSCHKTINYYENRRSLFRKATTFILNFIEAYVTRRANLITAPTNTIKQMTGSFWNIPENRIKLFPHPFLGSIPDNELRPIDGDYILYFGRLQELKGADLILDLCKENFLKNQPLKLILIGKDIYGFKNKLVGINNETVKKVEIMDHIFDKKLLFSYIKSAKVVFLPSKFESLGFTVLESLWFNPKTFVLNNSGPLEIMITLGLKGNLLDEQMLLSDPGYLIDKISQPINVNTDHIRKKIENIYGYNVTFRNLMNILKVVI